MKAAVDDYDSIDSLKRAEFVCKKRLTATVAAVVSVCGSFRFSSRIPFILSLSIDL